MATMQANGTIGADLARHDARDKVRGVARYAADRVPDGLAYAALATHDGLPGTLVSLGLERARAVPGVRMIVTHETLPALGEVGFLMAGGNAAQSWQPMASDEIRYFGQPVAMVVADTIEAAAAAAGRVVATVRPKGSVALELEDEAAEAFSLAEASEMFEDKAYGDLEAAMGDAAREVRMRFASAPQHQNPIELLATVASWEGDELTVHEPTQFAEGVRHGLATQLGIAPEKVRVNAEYIGGGFGQKNALMPHIAWVAIAARELGRPVKLMLTRPQTFSGASYRAAGEHEVHLGADGDGRLVAASHRIRTATSRHDAMPSMATETTSRMYAPDAFEGRETLVRLDLQTPGYMRSPFEAMGHFAFESAVDELAIDAGIDPLRFRLDNLAGDVDPVSGKPFSSNRLRECLERGADAFGWSGRPAAGSTTADGDHLVGWGCAVGAYKAALAIAEAEVALDGEGGAEVAVSGHEMGQGIRNVVAQMVADRLDLDPARVTVSVGVTGAVPQHLSAGSWGSPSAAEAVAAACAKLAGGTGRRARATVYPPGVPEAARARFDGGTAIAAGPEYPEFTSLAHAAMFVEVHVDRLTRAIRVPRALSVIDCGRVLAGRTARSQGLGGLVWGIASALHDGTEIDRRYGGWLNRDLGEYLLPVNADVRELDTILLDEPDPRLGAVGAKGLGEVSMTGTSAAIANAVRHATGVRPAGLPIRMEQLL